MRCERRQSPRHLAHLEIFIKGRVVLIPAGIGVSPRGCSYPLRTREPTGLVEVAGGGTLGDFFAVWGQRLPRGVKAFVGRQRFRGRPAEIRLDPHSVITLETGRLVPPHANYVFPP
ncbi:MAG: hypothetical protein QOI65_62 [Thermoleophilaceae bacterium]|nr:hypothetical protein [Thermoleophilaceae bacterium]